MKHLINSIVLIAYLLSSCGQKHANTETQQEVYYSSGKYYPQADSIINLTEKDLPKIEWFTLKKISVPKGYEDLTYYIYQDSILLIVSHLNPKPNPYMLTVMNYKTKEIIAQYFKYGKGNGKLKNLVVKLRENYLYVADAEKRIVSRMCIDSILTKGNAYTTVFTPYTSLNLMDYVYTNDSTITWTNTQYINGFGVDNVPNFVQTDCEGNLRGGYPQNDSLYTEYAMERSISAIKNSFYMEFWMNFPVLNIYDSNFNIIKQYRDTKFKDTDLNLVNGYMVMEKGAALENFSFGCQSEKYVLVNNFRSSVTFEGNVGWSGDPAYGEFYETWVFDNNCNLVRRFKCRNLKGQVVGLSYCDQTGNMYMNVIDEKGIRTFYQCIFEKQ